MQTSIQNGHSLFDTTKEGRKDTRSYHWAWPTHILGNIETALGQAQPLLPLLPTYILTFTELFIVSKQKFTLKWSEVKWRGVGFCFLFLVFCIFTTNHVFVWAALLLYITLLTDWLSNIIFNIFPTFIILVFFCSEILNTI